MSAGKPKYPALEHMLGAYLHQDWMEEFGSPDNAIASYIRDSSSEEKRAAAADIARLMATREITIDVLLELGGYYDPSADGKTVDQWLNDVRRLLE